MAKFTLATPWGCAQTQHVIGRGIMAVTTASHGGLFVPEELVSSIPAAGRRDAARWSGSDQWYEEDCCWAHVALAFPELFGPETLDAARRTNKSRGFKTGEAPCPQVTE